MFSVFGKNRWIEYISHNIKIAIQIIVYMIFYISYLKSANKQES